MKEIVCQVSIDLRGQKFILSSKNVFCMSRQAETNQIQSDSDSVFHGNGRKTFSVTCKNCVPAYRITVYTALSHRPWLAEAHSHTHMQHLLICISTLIGILIRWYFECQFTWNVATFLTIYNPMKIQTVLKKTWVNLSFKLNDSLGLAVSETAFSHNPSVYCCISQLW